MNSTFHQQWQETEGLFNTIFIAPAKLGMQMFCSFIYGINFHESVLDCGAPNIRSIPYQQTSRQVIVNSTIKGKFDPPCHSNNNNLQAKALHHYCCQVMGSTEFSKLTSSTTAYEGIFSLTISYTPMRRIYKKIKEKL